MIVAHSKEMNDFERELKQHNIERLDVVVVNETKKSE
jgi:hypothetical protein